MKFVTVPTLIIHGDEDKTVPIEATGKQSAKLIPNNTFIIYEGAPHGLFYTEREKLNADLVKFLTTEMPVAPTQQAKTAYADACRKIG